MIPSRLSLSQLIQELPAHLQCLLQQAKLGVWNTHLKLLGALLCQLVTSMHTRLMPCFNISMLLCTVRPLGHCTTTLQLLNLWILGHARCLSLRVVQRSACVRRLWYIVYVVTSPGLVLWQNIFVIDMVIFFFYYNVFNIHFYDSWIFFWTILYVC
jgi:hypothetical protein